MLLSFIEAGASLSRAGLATLCSEASTASGRVRAPVVSREDGRCCHESVPAREGAIAALGEVDDSVCGFEGACGVSRDAALASWALMLGGAPLALRGASSRPELPKDGGWQFGVFEKLSCMDILLFERTEPGVPALEEVSLIGDSDLARSVIANRVSSTHPHHPATRVP